MAAKPGFGVPYQTPEYYVSVSAIIAVLREYSTLRTIANHLSAQGFLTPSGKTWNRQDVANFIRSPQFKPTTN